MVQAVRIAEIVEREVVNESQLTCLIENIDISILNIPLAPSVDIFSVLEPWDVSVFSDSIISAFISDAIDPKNLYGVSIQCQGIL